MKLVSVVNKKLDYMNTNFFTIVAEKVEKVKKGWRKMNSKNMAKSLNAKLSDWCKYIDDEKIVKIVKENAIVTGGALVSLLNGEKPNDYDIYFKTKEAVKEIANYYANKWNEMHPEKNNVTITEEDGKIQCFIRSKGAVMEDEENAIDDTSEPLEVDQIIEETDEEVKEEKPKYRPRYFSTNAISLSNDIQIVIRFYGKVEKIHENYDFIHCTCSYDYKNNKVNLPAKALEAIINKELIYCGSKYPLCSIIRTRKFISRGYTINAGQYLKMALQLNELDLHNLEVFKDQLTGVDSAYFETVITYLSEKKEKDKNFQIDNSYLFEIINRIF